MSVPPPPSSTDEPLTPSGPGGAAPHIGAGAFGADPQCREAVAELYAFLDGELDDTTMVRLETHLRRCSPCLEAFDFETELRRVIATRCVEEVPPEIRERFCSMLRTLASGGDPSADPPGDAVGSGVPSGPDGS